MVESSSGSRYKPSKKEDNGEGDGRKGSQYGWGATPTSEGPGGLWLFPACEPTIGAVLWGRQDYPSPVELGCKEVEAAPRITPSKLGVARTARGTTVQDSNLLCL